MRTFFIVLLAIIGLLVALALGSGLLALMAYGLGFLLNKVMNLEPFQATVIALASLCIFGVFADRLWNAILSAPPFGRNEEGDEFDDEFFEDYEDEEEEAEEEPVIYSGIPRWRQPLKNPDFSNAKPDDRCPCGSGKKYKNCHGIKKKAN